MAQTTAGISMQATKVESSVDGTNWTDITGFSNNISWDGGERQTENTPTFGTDTHIITKGTRTPTTVTLKSVYTEGASDPTIVADAAYRAGTAYYLRWSPKGATSGTRLYTSTAGVVKKSTAASGESGSPATVMVEIVIECADVVPSTVTP